MEKKNVRFQKTETRKGVTTCWTKQANIRQQDRKHNREEDTRSTGIERSFT